MLRGERLVWLNVGAWWVILADRGKRGQARSGEGSKERSGRADASDLAGRGRWIIPFPPPPPRKPPPAASPPALAFSTLANPPDLCESLTDALLHDPELLPSRCGVACQKRPRADPYLLDAGSVPRINRWHWESWVHRRTGTSYVYIIVLPPP
jgi:hypothetical protein